MLEKSLRVVQAGAGKLMGRHIRHVECILAPHTICSCSNSDKRGISGAAVSGAQFAPEHQGVPQLKCNRHAEVKHVCVCFRPMVSVVCVHLFGAPHISVALQLSVIMVLTDV